MDCKDTEPDAEAEAAADVDGGGGGWVGILWNEMVLKKEGLGGCGEAKSDLVQETPLLGIIAAVNNRNDDETEEDDMFLSPAAMRFPRKHRSKSFVAFLGFSPLKRPRFA